MSASKSLENLNEIRDVARALLLKADADDRLPTPVDDIVAGCGLLESDDYLLSESKVSQAPRQLRKLLRSAGRKIRGALDRRERVLHVSPAIDIPAQRQFVKCHEAMHDALPWQRDLLVLGDTSLTLAPDVEFLFEREANQGGAELLFQVDLLSRIARDYPTDITTPVALAELFGASIHATFRRWIEVHSDPVCGMVLGPDP
jgi:IrrE N-terminal-like domain